MKPTFYSSTARTALLVTAFLLSFLALNVGIGESLLDSAFESWTLQAERYVQTILPSLSCRHSSPSPFFFTGSQHHCTDWPPSPRFAEPPISIHAAPLPTFNKMAHTGWDSPPTSPALLNLSLPLTQSELSRLHDLAQPSNVGLGNSSELRPQLRSSREIDGARLSISEALWESLDGVREALLSSFSWEMSSVVSIRLHKLLLYGEGDHFVRHSDTYKQEGMVATLLVLLPTDAVPLQGGALHVYHPALHLGWPAQPLPEEERVWDVGQLMASMVGDEALSVCRQVSGSEYGRGVMLSWVMFWSDCEHEVERVAGGQRAMLVFNLMVGGGVISGAESVSVR